MDTDNSGRSLRSSLQLFEGESHGPSYPRVNSVSYNTNSLDELCIVVQEQQDFWEDNQPLDSDSEACSTGKQV